MLLIRPPLELTIYSAPWPVLPEYSYFQPEHLPTLLTLYRQEPGLTTNKLSIILQGATGAVEE